MVSNRDARAGVRNMHTLFVHGFPCGLNEAHLILAQARLAEYLRLIAFDREGVCALAAIVKVGK